MAEEKEATTVCSNNVHLFQLAVSNSLRNIAESVSENEFIEIFTILKSKPSIARKLHGVMMKELYDSMNADLEDMLMEGSLQNALTKIAKLSEESTTSVNEDAWRPPGDITAHLRSLDAHTIEETTEELEKRVNEMETENEALMKTVMENRSKIRALDNSTIRILDRAPALLQRLQKAYEQLANSLRTIEGE